MKKFQRTILIVEAILVLGMAILTGLAYAYPDDAEKIRIYRKMMLADLKDVRDNIQENIDIEPGSLMDLAIQEIEDEFTKKVYERLPKIELPDPEEIDRDYEVKLHNLSTSEELQYDSLEPEEYEELDIVTYSTNPSTMEEMLSSVAPRMISALIFNISEESLISPVDTNNFTVYITKGEQNTNGGILGLFESTEFTDNNKQRLKVTVNHIKYEDTEKNCDYSAFLYTPENTYVKSGDIIYSKGVISSSVPTVKGKYNFENYLKCENMDFVFFAENIYLKNHDKLKITDYIDSIRNSLVSNFYSILPEREASVVSAVVMGYDSLLTDETRDVYSAGGIAHMLAVSGLHVSVMYGFIIYVLSKILSTKRSYVVSIFFVAFYAVFTGMSSSVVRASIMTEIMLLGMVLEKRSDGLNSLCAAVTLMVIFNPYVKFR